MKKITLPKLIDGKESKTAWNTTLASRLPRLSASLLIDYKFSHVHKKVLDVMKGRRHDLYLNLIELCLEVCDREKIMIPRETINQIFFDMGNKVLQYNSKAAAKITSKFRTYLRKCITQDPSFEHSAIFSSLFSIVFRYAKEEYTALANDILDISYRKRIKVSPLWTSKWLHDFVINKHYLDIDSVFENAFSLWKEVVYDISSAGFIDNTRQQFVEFMLKLAGQRPDLIKEIILHACQAVTCPSAMRLLQRLDHIIVEISNPLLFAGIVENKKPLQEAMVAIYNNSHSDFVNVCLGHKDILRCLAICLPEAADANFWRQLYRLAKQDLSLWLVYAAAVPAFFPIVESALPMLTKNNNKWEERFVTAVNLLWRWPGCEASVLPDTNERNKRLSHLYDFIQSSPVLQQQQNAMKISSVSKQIAKLLAKE